MGKRGPKPMSYEKFKSKYLVEGFVDGKGNPVHTRLLKKYLYKFNEELKREYGFDLRECSECSISEWNGRPIVMELDHINRVTNDGRIENLRPLCPNCHQQTDGYANRKVSIERYVEELWK